MMAGCFSALSVGYHIEESGFKLWSENCVLFLSFLLSTASKMWIPNKMLFIIINLKKLSIKKTSLKSVKIGHVLNK